MGGNLSLRMPLDNFRIPKTPETRTPYVLAVSAIIGVLSGALQWFIGFKYAGGLTLVVAALAIAYVVWRFVRRKADTTAHPSPPSPRSHL